MDKWHLLQKAKQMITCSRNYVSYDEWAKGNEAFDLYINNVGITRIIHVYKPFFQLDDATLQVYKDGDYGAYLDLESSLAEQSEEIEGLHSKYVFGIKCMQRKHLTNFFKWKPTLVEKCSWISLSAMTEYILWHTAELFSDIKTMSFSTREG